MKILPRKPNPDNQVQAKDLAPLATFTIDEDLDSPVCMAVLNPAVKQHNPPRYVYYVVLCDTHGGGFAHDDDWTAGVIKSLSAELTVTLVDTTLTLE